MFSVATVCSENGKVFSFGSNKFGQLGLVHPTPSVMTTPTQVEPMVGVVKVACGRYHSAAIDGEWLVVRSSLAVLITESCVVVMVTVYQERVSSGCGAGGREGSLVRPTSKNSTTPR